MVSRTTRHRATTVYRNRDLKHLPQRAESKLVQIFNPVLLGHHFPTVWKKARVSSILKPGKDPTLPSSYRTIILFDGIGKLFEKILPTMILLIVRDRGLMRDEQFDFRPKHSRSLQLARFDERISRNFAKDVDRRGLPRRGQSLRYRLERWSPLKVNAHKLPVLHSPHKFILPPGRTFETSFRTATSSHRGMRAELAQGELISHALFSLYVNEMTPTPNHFVLAVYADDTAIIPSSNISTLLVSYVESYLNKIQQRLTKCRMAINVSKCTTIIFARGGRSFTQSRPVTLFEEPI